MTIEIVIGWFSFFSSYKTFKQNTIMNRKILFRAKRADTNEWVEGDLIQLDSRFMIADKGMTAYDKGNVHEEISIECVEIIPETLGELVDSETKLFEGDIVQTSNDEIRQIMHCRNSFEMRKMNGQRDSQNITWCFAYIKIGNIHDNPEMLVS